MNLNPGQWTWCHLLRCKSLNAMECTAESCSYGTREDKIKTYKDQRKAHFNAVQEKQNAPRIAAEKAKAAEILAKAQSRAETLRGGH